MHCSYENGSTSFYENVHQMHSLAHRWDPEKHGIAYIMAGMGHVPYADHLYHYLRSGSEDNFEHDIDKIYQEYKKYAKMMEENILTLPTSYEFLKENIYS